MDDAQSHLSFSVKTADEQVAAPSASHPNQRPLLKAPFAAVCLRRKPQLSVYFKAGR
jgi:hypothetical protein